MVLLSYSFEMEHATTQTLPKTFVSKTEILPLNNQGLSSFEKFKKTQEGVHHVEWLKSVGLTNEEVEIYQQNESGTLQQRSMEAGVMASKLDCIYHKIQVAQDNEASNTVLSNAPTLDTPCTTSTVAEKLIDKIKPKSISFYPEGHPMNNLDRLEKDIIGHLKSGEIMPLSKRRKLLRRLERKQERANDQEKMIKNNDNANSISRPGSLWDVKEPPSKINRIEDHKKEPIVGPKKPTLYTIKDSKIVRLEPTSSDGDNNCRAVDIVLPVNAAEARLLEGTKMTIDDIKKIYRFKDYTPGTPSKVLYLKNIASSATGVQVALLFNQFTWANGAPPDVRLLGGRMRGQAFVGFQSEEIAIQALEEVNGTILNGRPIIIQFGRNSNRIQDDNT